ncbi:MAG: hypothetical protein DWQ36_22230 [Acidobacteria bacterium]|nr:MAG: hypothetical protein DWQ30_00310 [Acidobacteriota bacterium]REK00905.1 MAG: hypothetical protein DWQ36_22230 [Acidobacteriota bacterium]
MGHSIEAPGWLGGTVAVALTSAMLGGGLAQAQLAQLTRDLAVGSLPTGDGEWIEELLGAGDRATFVSSANGREPMLWGTDGTAVGTVLLPIACDPDCEHEPLFENDGRAYWWASEVGATQGESDSSPVTARGLAPKSWRTSPCSSERCRWRRGSPWCAKATGRYRLLSYSRTGPYRAVALSISRAVPAPRQHLAIAS